MSFWVHTRLRWLLVPSRVALPECFSMAIDYYLNYCSPQGQIKTMARPEGAQALRAIQKDLDEGRSLPGINYILPYREGLVRWMLLWFLFFAPKK